MTTSVSTESKPKFADRFRGQSVIALVDQAVTSGATFATVVIIGRAAGAEALGVYSLAITLLLVVSSAQESLVSSPFTFYGNKQDGKRSELAGSTLVHAFCLMMIAATTMAVAALLLRGTALADVLWVLAAMTPLLMSRDLARKFAFADLRMHVALVIDLIAAVIQLVALGWLAWSGNLTASTAFWACGLACGVAGLGWVAWDNRRFQINRGRIATDWRAHWKFGKWVLAGVVTILIHINVVRWLVAFGIDNAAAGIFAACMAIAMLSSPFIQGINNVLMPRAARAFHQGGSAAVANIVWRTTVYVLIAMAMFSVIVFVFGGWAVPTLYGPGFAGNHAVTCVLVMFMVSRAIDTSVYNGIWSLERPDANVRINLVAMTATVIFASALMSAWGIVGAAVGLLLGDLCGCSLRCWTFLSLTSTPSSSQASLNLGAE